MHSKFCYSETKYLMTQTNMKSKIIRVEKPLFSILLFQCLREEKIIFTRKLKQNSKK